MEQIPSTIIGGLLAFLGFVFWRYWHHRAKAKDLVAKLKDVNESLEASKAEINSILEKKGELERENQELNEIIKKLTDSGPLPPQSDPGKDPLDH